MNKSLWALIKQILQLLIQTTMGRVWLAVMLGYGVVGPVVLSLVLPPEGEGGFWADAGREWMESGPFSLAGILIGIFVLIPLIDRRRRRKAAKQDFTDG